MKNQTVQSQTEINHTKRQVINVIEGQMAMDGDGVKLTRIIGSQALNMLDPFLLLDVFESDQAQDYIGGFPSHPHRGFETVTYLLAGQIRHKDSAGNEGLIKPGGVQWMTAGKGIVHSEMPEQIDGLLMGFQLWVNLPAKAKLNEPAYQEFPVEEIAIEEWASGSQIRVIAGQTNQGTLGPVINHYVHPTYMDISLKANDEFQQTLSQSDNTFVYVIQGEVQIGASQPIKAGQLAILSEGEHLSVNTDKDSRFLLASGQPIGEPVARGGPFVMNTKAEILQAFEDFQSNRF